MRAGRITGALALTLVSTMLIPAAIWRADAATAPTAGDSLPLLDIDRPTAGISAASGQYWLLSGGEDYDELDPHEHISVVRSSDGQTVRSFDVPLWLDTYHRPQVAGSSIVQLFGADSAHQNVEVRDAVTGDLERTIDISGEGLVHADATWVLVWVSTGPSTIGLRLVHADGTATSVQGTFSDVPTWVGGDAHTAYVTGSGGGLAIDAAAGTTTPLPFPDGAQLAFVTPTSLIASVEGYVNGTWGTRFRTLSRATLQPGWSTDVPGDYHNEALEPLGDGLAVIYRSDNATEPVYEHMQLRPVVLATGALAEPIATDVFTYRALPDGQLALTIADTPGGRLAIAAADGVHPFFDLPDERDQSLGVGLSGSLVATSWQWRDGVWTTTANGSGNWADGYPAPTFTPGDNNKEISLAGDVVMTSDVNDSTTTYHLQWPGGSRDFVADDALLGHGGTYAERIRYGSANTVEIIDVRTGEVVRTFPDTVRRVLDGTWVWPAADGAGVLTGTDLRGGAAPRAVQLPPGCARAEVDDVRGRWAQVDCASGRLVVDLDGQVAATVVPTGNWTWLGGGFLISTQPITAGTSWPLQLLVIDLVTGASRTYGPIRANSYPPGIDVATNDDGSPDFAYVDTTYHVRHVRLDWLASASTTPALVKSPSLAHAYSSTTAHQVSLSWAWFNATSYDVRRGDRTGTSWTTPTAWQGLSTPSVSDSIEPATGACYDARAHGADGSVSAWSDPVCQYVDGAAPVITAAPQIAAVVAATSPVPTTVAWSYDDPSSGLSDGSSIVSYDLRWAPRGTSDWTTPTSWTGVAQPSASLAIAPGTGVCFSSRARDEAGNTSPWSPVVCRYVDGAAPRFGVQSGSEAYPAALSSVPSFSASATDDTAVASYDVERSVAAPGRPLGAWTRVVDAGPLGQASGPTEGPGQETCFRARARDSAGNVSAWTAPRCTTTPVDDRAMVMAGHHASARSAGAIGRTLTKVWGRRSSVALRGQRGTAVAVWIRRAPGLGTARVYAAGRLVGRIRFAAPSGRRAQVLLLVPGGFVGAVKVAPRTSAPIYVDAIAVAR